MKAIISGIAVTIAMSADYAHAEDAQGYWSGNIGGVLQVIVQFDKPASGPWEASISVPAQNLKSKVEDVVVTPDRIAFALPRFKASYQATWNEQAQVWTGTWTQGRTAPLELKRTSADALKRKRPQEEAIATSPPPYSSQEVSFDNETAGVKLAGTFSVPHGHGPFPAVVLVHGSGSINRDADVFGHKLFLVLADYLNRQGIAVLRYDKRGVGKSTGKLRDATMADLAADAEAAVRYLRGRHEVDTRHLGIIGHSEGGMIAPLLASRDPALGFVVMLAGPGIRGDRLLVEQLELLARAQGQPEREIARDRKLHEEVFAAMLAEPSLEAANAKARAIVEAAERRGEQAPGRGELFVRRFGTPWFRAMLDYDPAPALMAVHQPVLVLNGTLDLQVPASIDLAAIRTALRDNPRAVVKEMPGLNHPFQMAKTGAPAEYVEIEETMAPVALDTIGSWIAATIR
ncbi:lysophospholipase [Massilia agilis]|uniref:Lysophospholipase n=1 Tax=Massilia agilis TaxID=1811226 RepID=A0ABT2D6E3_9BURK|nr:alpha/beta hydrolase [Massilia agilis]MCS0806870.1 lysophospholipase [Massilia agilis]